jgi:5-methylcytosine-specific restriction endonuclease McrA
MKSTASPWAVYSIINRKDKIDPKPQYQRGSVWTMEKKQLLIDTMLRQYDIPKIYLRVVDNGSYEHEVVDGQQRLRSIWSFVNNEFPLGEESKDFDDMPDLVGKYYKDLSGDQQDRIGSFVLTVTELYKTSDIEVRELFLRLQEGTTLNPPEKRNAMFGNMRDFVSVLSDHPILLKTTVKNTRFQFDDLVAHVCRLELSGGPADIKAADLKAFYESQKDFNTDSNQAKKIKKVMNYLNKSFDENTPELSIKWGFVDLYLLVSYLLDEYVMQDRHLDVYEFYIGFETERRKVSDPADLLVGGNGWKRDLYDYINAFQREGAKRSNLETRHNVYLKKFLYDYPDLMPKDGTRNFSNNERIVLWRKASKKCQNPSCGKEVSIEEMHADHIVPHSAGGKTTIDNGQCLCKSCNLSKSNS